MSSYKGFQDYLEYLCEMHKQVAHNTGGRRSFYKLNVEEEVAAISGKAASPSVHFINFHGTIRNELLECSALIYFLVHVPTGLHSIEVEKARAQAFGILLEFYNRILVDYEDGDKCSFFNQLNNPDFQPTGPHNQNSLGWAFTLRFSMNLPLYDPGKWS